MRGGGRVIGISLLACLTQTPESPAPVLVNYNLTEKTLMMDERRQYPHTTVMPTLDYSDERWVEADMMFQEGNYLATAQSLLSLLREQPNHVAAHSLLSSTFIQLGDIDQALSAAQKVVEIHPSAWSYSNLGSLYILLNDFKMARTTFLTALEQDPKFYLALRNLGSIAYQEKDYVSAEKYFRDFIRLDPEDSYSYLALGQVLADQGKVQQAKEVYQYRLQELEWDEEPYRKTSSGVSLDLPLALAEAHRRLGETSEALYWLKQSLIYSQRYDGYYASSEVYEDRTYERLMELLSTLSTEPRDAEIADLRSWCSGGSHSMEAMVERSESGHCEQLESWIQSMNKTAPVHNSTGTGQ